MVTVELCAGAGGLARGFSSAGFDIGVAVERDGYAAKTYRRNFPKVEVIESDIRSISGGGILNKLGMGRGDVGILLAGLPCQGFSESNRRTRTESNPKNFLYREVVRLLTELRPRWCVLENVAGIATLKSGDFLGRMLEEFSRVGYRVECGILNAEDFGVPQCRRRAFLVGTRMEWSFGFPDGRVGPGVRRPTVRDAIGDLPRLRNGASVGSVGYGRPWREVGEYARELRPVEMETVSGCEVSRNSERVVERYKYIGMGQNWRAIPSRLMTNYGDASRCHTGIYYRLKWGEQAKVIGNFRKNMLIHPSQDRGLSIREAARLQSFDDRHEFCGPLNHRQQQVGDAVPPLLAQVVAEAVKSSEV